MTKQEIFVCQIDLSQPVAPTLHKRLKTTTTTTTALFLKWIKSSSSNSSRSRPKFSFEGPAKGPQKTSLEDNALRDTPFFEKLQQIFPHNYFSRPLCKRLSRSDEPFLNLAEQGLSMRIMASPNTENASPIAKHLIDRNEDELTLQIQKANTKPLMDGYADVFRICRFLPENYFDEIRVYDWIEVENLPVAENESVRPTSPLSRITSVYAREDLLAGMGDIRAITFHKLDHSTRQLLQEEVEEEAYRENSYTDEQNGSNCTVLKHVDKQFARDVKKVNPLGIMDFLVDNVHRLGQSVITEYSFDYEIRDGKPVPTKFRIILGYTKENEAFAKLQRKYIKDSDRTSRNKHN